jgi:hypothetical protein
VPPEFYIDENLSGRTTRRFIADLGYVVQPRPRSSATALLERNLGEVCALAMARRPNVYWLTPQGTVPYERRVARRRRGRG